MKLKMTTYTFSIAQIALLYTKKVFFAKIINLFLLNSARELLQYIDTYKYICKQICIATESFSLMIKKPLYYKKCAQNS